MEEKEIKLVGPPQEKDNVVTGIFPGVPYEEYDSWPFVRQSNLWVLFDRTPAHYHYAVTHSEKDKEHFLVGHATHTAVLEPELFDKTFATLPETYTNTKGEEKKWSAGAAVCKEYVKEQKSTGLVLLSSKQYELCQRLRDSAYADPFIKDILESSEKEVSIVWNDEKTGLTMKARIDMWVSSAGVLADLKTTKNAAVRIFGAQAYRYGYHFQASLYFDGLTQVSDNTISNPILLSLEKDPPYLPAHDEVLNDELTCGRTQYEYALDRLLECNKTGKWPGYNPGLRPLVLPSYAGMELSST